MCDKKQRAKPGRWGRRRWLFVLGLLVLLVSVYPAFVLGYTWQCVWRADLEGGRNGPLDAYRHALASSVVAYTLGEMPVELVTDLFEGRGHDSNQMDSHNNRIGAQIGSKARSFAELEPAVRVAVMKGAVESCDSNQITWLPRKKWRDGRMW